MNPEFFHRHGNSLAKGEHAHLATPFTLPSSQRIIFQMTLMTVGRQVVGSDLKSLDSTRDSATQNMEKFLKLLSAGEGWKLNDSVVRAFNLHCNDRGKKFFDIEQIVRIYLVG